MKKRTYQAKRPCKARSARTGRPCSKGAIAGGAVCTTHGGSAPQVKAAARERLMDLIDPDRVLREAARIAYFDPRRLFTPEGQLLPVSEWPEDVAAAVGHLEIAKRNLDPNDRKTDDVLKVRPWDKPKALEMLCKHLQLYEEKVQHTGEITFRWED